MKKCLLIIFLAWSMQVAAQEVLRPFQKEVNAFVLQDSLHPPVGQPILCIGSSSFTKWKDIEAYFPGWGMLNRGFGGSSLLDVIYYAPQVIFPYNPRQILIYCGENDIAATPQPTTKTVVKRCKQLLRLIRSKWKDVPIIYISIKPSPLRWKLESSFVEANRGIQRYMQKQKNMQLLDVHSAMLTATGEPNPELYIADRLHMNEKGYEIWKNLLLPLLMPR